MSDAGMSRPRGRPRKVPLEIPADQPKVQTSGINYSRPSPLDPKVFLKDKFDPTKGYRWVRQDNVDRWRSDGYETVESGKTPNATNRYREMVLMETSRDNKEERKKMLNHAAREQTQQLRRMKDSELRQERPGGGFGFVEEDSEN